MHFGRVVGHAIAPQNLGRRVTGRRQKLRRLESDLLPQFPIAIHSQRPKAARDFWCDTPRQSRQPFGIPRDGQLWRDFAPERNLELADVDLEEDDGFHQLLLQDVEDFQLRLLFQGAITSKGKSALEGREFSEDWLQKWPDNNQQGASAQDLPLAVEITIELKGVGSSVRLFAMPEQ